MLDYEKKYEKEAFKNLSPKAKAEHIWEYYKLPIFLGLLALAVGIWALFHYVINPPAPVGLNVYMYASGYDTKISKELEKEYSEAMAPSLGESELELRVVTDYAMDLNYYSYQETGVTQITAYAMADEIDILIGTQSYLLKFQDAHMYIDFESFFAPDEWSRLLAKSGECLQQYLADGGETELALSVIKTDFEYNEETKEAYPAEDSGTILAAYGLGRMNELLNTNGEILYVGIVNPRIHPEAVHDFIMYLFLGELPNAVTD